MDAFSFGEGGFAELRATLQMADGSELNATTKIFASTREKLSEKELWLDKYLDTFSDHPYIFNLGHGILPETDPQMMDYLVKTVKDY